MSASDVGSDWIVVVSLLVFVLLRTRFPRPSHEGLYLLEGKRAVFVGIHRLEDFFVGGLEFLQRDGSVTIAIHQSEEMKRADASTGLRRFQGR